MKKKMVVMVRVAVMMMNEQSSACIFDRREGENVDKLILNLHLLYTNEA